MDIDKAPVFIDDDVWIACGVVILQGVTIGRGAIVGADSVVTQDLPAWTFVLGNPARITREPKAKKMRDLPVSTVKSLYFSRPRFEQRRSGC